MKSNKFKLFVIGLAIALSQFSTLEVIAREIIKTGSI